MVDQNNMSNIPKDGTIVTGMTYSSIEYDRESEEVTGELRTRPSPFSNIPQCWIDGVQVDPSTIKSSSENTMPTIPLEEEPMPASD